MFVLTPALIGGHIGNRAVAHERLGEKLRAGPGWIGKLAAFRPSRPCAGKSFAGVPFPGLTATARGAC